MNRPLNRIISSNLADRNQALKVLAVFKHLQYGLMSVGRMGPGMKDEGSQWIWVNCNGLVRHIPEMEGHHHIKNGQTVVVDGGMCEICMVMVMIRLP